MIKLLILSSIALTDDGRKCSPIHFKRDNLNILLFPKQQEFYYQCSLKSEIKKWKLRLYICNTSPITQYQSPSLESIKESGFHSTCCFTACIVQSQLSDLSLSAKRMPENKGLAHFSLLLRTCPGILEIKVFKEREFVGLLAASWTAQVRTALEFQIHTPLLQATTYQSQTLCSLSPLHSRLQQLMGTYKRTCFPYTVYCSFGATRCRLIPFNIKAKHCCCLFCEKKQFLGLCLFTNVYMPCKGF